MEEANMNFMMAAIMMGNGKTTKLVELENSTSQTKSYSTLESGIMMNTMDGEPCILEKMMIIGSNMRVNFRMEFEKVGVK